MSDIYTLIDACCEAIDLPEFKPRDGQTFCNRAVQYVANRLGYRGFPSGMMANDMIKLMVTSPDWLPIEIDVAQRMANTGSLVIACQAHEPHGHVVVIRPGHESFSGKWGKPAPRVMNVGAENFISRSLSFVFKDIPAFYVWKES